MLDFLIYSVQYPASSIQHRDTLDKSADQYYSISGLTGNRRMFWEAILLRYGETVYMYYVGGNEKGIALAKTSYRELQNYICGKTKPIN